MSFLGRRLQWLAIVVSRRLEDSLPLPTSARETVHAHRYLLKATMMLMAVAGLLSLLGGLSLLIPPIPSYSPVTPVRNPTGHIDSKQKSMNESVALDIRRLNEHLGSKPYSSSAHYDLHGVLDKRAPGWDSSMESKFHAPLNRKPTDARTKQCKERDYGPLNITASVIFIFCNEPFETLMRSVHGVLNTAPPHLLKEIILVDDGSDAAHILPGGLVEQHLTALPPKVRLLRTGRRSGIAMARLTGIRAAKGDAFVMLDSHIEPQPGWLEPLLYPISVDRRNVVMPQIDGIEVSTHKLTHGGIGCTLGLIWMVMEHSFDTNTGLTLDRKGSKYEDFVSSPTMAGGLFAASRDFFLELGGYDEGMRGWGAENVEFSFRLWQCGGRLVCTQCSRIHHMFGGGKYYNVPPSSTAMNRMRTMRAWMDEFADLAWRVNGKPNFSEIGDLSNMKKIKSDLQCKDFHWFLKNVWPESSVKNLPRDVPYDGVLINLASNDCINPGYRGAGSVWTLEKCQPGMNLLYWRETGGISLETNDETCLKSDLSWNWCETSPAKFEVVEIEGVDKQKLRESFHESTGTQLDAMYEQMEYKTRSSEDPIVVVRIRNSKGKCLGISEKERGQRIKLLECDGDNDNQKWIWARYEIHPFWLTKFR